MPACEEAFQLYREVILPHEAKAAARDRDNQPLPIAMLTALASRGMLRPRPWESWGWTLFALGYLCDELSVPFVLSYEAGLAKHVGEAKQPFLDQRYVETLYAGHRFGGFSWTEGADPFAFRTTAERTPNGGWILNGKKGPVSCGVFGDYFLVYARHGSDMASVIVERKDAGVTVTPAEPMGLRATGQAMLTFDDVRLGPERTHRSVDAVSYGQCFLNDRRIAISCFVLGHLERLLEKIVDNLGGRIRYRVPLTEMQAIQAQLGRAYAKLYSARATMTALLESFRDRDIEMHDRIWSTGVASTKYVIVELAIELVAITQRVLGGTWYYEDAPFSRWMRDLLGLVPAAGTQGILEVDLGVIAVNDIERQRRHRG